MPFNPSSIDNPWEFEDCVRRASQLLFDPTLPERRVKRNRNYRIGVLQILDGLLSETPFTVLEGMERISSQFPRVEPPEVHKTTVEIDLPVSSESE